MALAQCNQISKNYAEITTSYESLLRKRVKRVQEIEEVLHKNLSQGQGEKAISEYRTIAKEWLVKMARKRQEVSEVFNANTIAQAVLMTEVKT
jgi:hypothetical protein